MISQTTVQVEEDALTLDLHVILTEDVNVVFHPPSLTFFTVSRNAAEILKSYSDGTALEDCAAQHACSPEDLLSLLQHLHQDIVRQNQRHPATIYETSNLGDRLTMLVSQDCNLRCRYCNAAGGDYGQERANMSAEVAIQTLEAFTGDDFYFSNIQFFGGEPTLNVPVLRVMCDHLAQMVVQGRISRMPGLGIITNGLHFTDDFLALVNDYDIQVTVSLDGPAPVTDAQRVDLGGRGAYKRIVNSMRKLQAATDGRKPEMIEATMTRRHFELGITYDNLIDFFADEFDVRRVHIAMLEEGLSYDTDLAISQPERLEWHKTTHASLLKRLVKGEPKADNIGFRALKKLVFKHINPYLCPVGISSLTVDKQGNIYPCYTLMADEFFMGTVFDPNVTQSERYEGIQQRLRINSKHEFEKCRACWARTVCSGCVGEIYASKGVVEDRIEAICQGIKESTEILLCGLARLRTDKAAWTETIALLKNDASGPGREPC